MLQLWTDTRLGVWLQKWKPQNQLDSGTTMIKKQKKDILPFYLWWKIVSKPATTTTTKHKNTIKATKN